MSADGVAGERPPSIVHENGRIRYVNEPGLGMLECDAADDLLGESVFDFVADRHRTSVAEQFEDVRAGNISSGGHTVEITTPSGESRVVIALSTVVTWEGDDCIQTVFFDIDGQLSPSLSARTMDASPIGISVADATQSDEPLVYVNDGFVELTGYPREEVVGRNCRFLQGEETSESTVAEVGAAIDAKEPVTVELRNYRKDGSMFWNRLSVQPIRNDEGTVTHFLGFQEDVSDKKLHEQEHALFELQADAIEQAIFITDAHGTIEYVNPAFERATGYSADEAIGENPRLLKSDQQDEEFYNDLWETISTGDVWEAEIINQRKSGERYRVKQKIVPITNEAGEITNFVAVEEDVTEARFAEEVLSVMDRVLRHNVRNSVNVIRGYANLLESGIDEAEHRAAVDTIRDHADQLESLSDDTRTIRELFRRRYAQHSLSVGTIEGFVDARREQHPAADIAFSSDADLELEIQNGSLLQLAIDEALENAIVHNDGDVPRVAVTVDQPEGDSEIRITIADDGPGIPEDQWAGIASGGETALVHSTGIGLWLIYWTVTALGGTVDRTSNEPRGTTLTLRVPTSGGDRPDR